MPHWLVFGISVLALSVPIAGLLFIVWLALVRPTSFIISLVELAYIAVGTVLIATAMASYVFRSDRHAQERQSRDRVSGGKEVITGPQLLQARLFVRWAPRDLAQHAKVPVSIMVRAESSFAEPTVTIAQLNTLMQALRSAGASFRHRNDYEMVN